MNTLYMEDILDHYKHPRNAGHISNPSITVHDSNPVCGDDVTFTVATHKKVITDIKFAAAGCAISIAASSKLTESIKGKTLQDIMQMHPEYVLHLLSIPLSPIRIKCALLGLLTLQKGIAHHLHGGST